MSKYIALIIGNILATMFLYPIFYPAFLALKTEQRSAYHCAFDLPDLYLCHEEKKAKDENVCLGMKENSRLPYFVYGAWNHNKGKYEDHLCCFGTVIECQDRFNEFQVKKYKRKEAEAMRKFF